MPDPKPTPPAACPDPCDDCVCISRSAMAATFGQWAGIDGSTNVFACIVTAILGCLAAPAVPMEIRQREPVVRK